VVKTPKAKIDKVFLLLFVHKKKSFLFCALHTALASQADFTGCNS